MHCSSGEAHNKSVEKIEKVRFPRYYRGSWKRREHIFILTLSIEMCLVQVPSDSSSGGISRQRWAISKASWMFCLGSLDKLSLRSTRAGFMDLIKATMAIPLLQLFPKSCTCTPNLFGRSWLRFVCLHSFDFSIFFQTDLDVNVWTSCSRVLIVLP